MPRPSTINNGTILEVARRLFLAGGREITTAEIAREAGISEGSIYKRYPTKEQLFLAAMGVDQPAWIEDLPALAGQATVQINLEQLARQGIAFFEEVMPRMMLLWAPGANGKLRAPIVAGPIRVLEALTSYFAAEQQAGRVCCEDPEVVARMFLAAIANYVFFKAMGVSLGGRQLDPEGYAAQVASALVSGITPSPSPSAPAESPQDNR
jgi:AcrR family transcriptional regulator